MLLLALVGCLEETESACLGVDPTPLYGSQRWEGEPGSVLSLATFAGPGRLCETTCTEVWVSPGLARGFGACQPRQTTTDIEAGDDVTFCAVVDAEATGEATCTLQLPGGPADFVVAITNDGSA